MDTPTDATPSEVPAEDNAAEQAATPIEGQEAPKVAPPATPAKLKFKYKVKDQEIEEELEHDEVQKRLQKVYGIEKKAEESSKQYKMAVELIRLLKEDPLEFSERAKSVGIDPKKLAIDIIKREIEFEKMTPEQRELEQFRKERAVKEKTAEAEKKAALDASLAKKTEAFRETIQKDMIAAIEEFNLPQNQWTAARFAAYLQAGLERGVQYSMKDIGRQVEIEWHQAMNAQLERYSDDKVLEKLSPAALEKIAKARMKKLQPQDPKPQFGKKAPKSSSTPDGKDGGNYWKNMIKSNKNID